MWGNIKLILKSFHDLSGTLAFISKDLTQDWELPLIKNYHSRDTPRVELVVLMHHICDENGHGELVNQKFSIMKTLYCVPILLLASIIFACEAGTESGETSFAFAGDVDFTDEEINEIPTTQQPSEETIQRKLVKTAKIEFQTNNLTDSRKTILQSVKKFKGYISNESEYQLGGQATINLTVRVPGEDFDAFIASSTSGVENFDRKEINTRDVTEEFVDLQARAKTKKELEQRYHQILEKANTVDDILKIENQIGVLRADIESMEGRMKYLSNQVSLSTVSFEFYEELPVPIDQQSRFGAALINGWKGAVSFLVVLVNLWPVLILTILVIVLLKFRKKKVAPASVRE